MDACLSFVPGCSFFLIPCNFPVSSCLESYIFHQFCLQEKKAEKELAGEATSSTPEPGKVLKRPAAKVDEDKVLKRPAAKAEVEDDAERLVGYCGENGPVPDDNGQIEYEWEAGLFLPMAANASLFGYVHITCLFQNSFYDVVSCSSLQVTERFRQKGELQGEIWRVFCNKKSGETFRSFRKAADAGFSWDIPHLLVKR